MAWNQVLELRRFLLELDPSEVERISDLGHQLAFKDAARTLFSAKELLGVIDPDIGAFVPDHVTGRVSELLNNLVAQINRARAFSANKPNAPQERVEIEQSIANVYYEVFRELAPLAAISRSQEELQERFAREIESLRSSAETKEAERLARAEALTRQIEEHASAVSAILTEARKASAELATSQEADHFNEAGGGYARRATTWLWVSIGGIAALLVLASVSVALALGRFYEDISPTSATQIALSKFVLLGIVAYATSLAARNYFANRHNEVVNKHRANAISSYRALVEATNSPEHRDVVLNHAASAVFSPQDTAFTKQSGQAPDVPTTIINSLTKPAQT